MRRPRRRLTLAEIVRREGFEPKRVVAVDLDAHELVVVSDEAYRRRDFSRLERIPFTEALWIP